MNANCPVTRYILARTGLCQQSVGSLPSVPSWYGTDPTSRPVCKAAFQVHIIGPTKLDRTMHSTLRARHRRVMDRLLHQYERKIMDNVERGAYVECMIAEHLGPDWVLAWEMEFDWASWDLQHTPTGTRVEIKSSARRQPWHTIPESKAISPKFSLKWPVQYWDGVKYVRISEGETILDFYIFAWHGEPKQGIADHRNPDQWEYYVARLDQLPKGRKSIGLPWLKANAKSCTGEQLATTLEEAIDSLKV